MSIPIEAMEQALAELLRLGSGAEILAPVRLRRRIVDLLEDTAALYR